MSFFLNANLTFPTDNNDINSWADYCELFCLISEDKSSSIDNLRDILLDQFQNDYVKAHKSIRLANSNTGKFILASMDAIEEEESEEDAVEQVLESSDFPDVNPEQQDNESFLSDKITEEFLFLFRFLESRQNLFGDSYPLRIDIRNNRIELLELPISDKQRIYVALLLSSILRIFSPGIRNKLGHLFEEVSLFPFRKMISSEARIEFFGAGKDAVGDPYFTGTFSQRVVKLAETLKSDTTNIFKENSHDYAHVGDGGLDWVAWVPFLDNISKMPVFFGQCACGDDWIDKEWDAHDDKWSNLIQLNDSYLLFHFVGKSYRKQDGSWYKPGAIYKLVLIDRLRIITSLREEDFPVITEIYNGLVDEALEIKQSVI